MHGLGVFWRENRLRGLSLAMGLVIWELVARQMETPLLPGSIKVFRTLFGAMWADGIPNDPDHGLAMALGQAIVPMFTGFFLAIVVGISIGVLMGISRKAGEVVNPIINALYVAPISALVPVMIFWFGMGFTARVMIVFLFSVFVLTVNTYQGVRHTSHDLVEMAHSFGASRRFIIRHIVIPNAVPYIMVGLRLGIGRAMRGVVVSELIIAVTGIGIIVYNFSGYFRIDGLLAVAIAIMGVGILFSGFVQWLERALTPWKKRDNIGQ